MVPIVADPLLDRSRRDGPRRALVDAGAGLWASWFDLDGLANSWSRQLQRHGYAPGARVAVVEPAGVRLAALLFACWRAGYVLVPLSPRAPAPEVERVLADCRPAGIVRDGDLADLPGPATGPEGDAVIVYTSGTTGAPKGVRLTTANLVASALGCREALDSTPRDRWLLCLAGHHVGGLAVLVRAAISNEPAVVLPGFEEKQVLDAIRRERCTLVSLVPAMLSRLLAAGGLDDLRTLRAILLGGAPAPAAKVLEWARLGLPVCPTYGLSETGSQVATVPPGRAEELAGTAGFVHSRAAVDIVDGRIILRGEVLSPGYVNPALEPAPGPGGFDTRDTGHFDDRGALVVTGRADDAIITGGENVQPVEVEDVLRAFPGVIDVVVVGVPDATYGSVLEARVVGEVDGDSLRAFAREQLAHFKVPRHVVSVPEIPRSDGGKVLRRNLV